MGNYKKCLLYSLCLIATKEEKYSEISVFDDKSELVRLLKLNFDYDYLCIVSIWLEYL